MLLSLARAHGTTAPTERYYREHLQYYRRGLRYYRKGLRYYRKGLRYYRSGEQYYRMPQISNTRSPSFCREDNKG